LKTIFKGRFTQKYCYYLLTPNEFSVEHKIIFLKYCEIRHLKAHFQVFFSYGGQWVPSDITHILCSTEERNSYRFGTT